MYNLVRPPCHLSNENHPASTAWQYHFIDYIHEYEKRKVKQHPVGMTFQHKGGKNQTLIESRADWISPNPSGGYRDNPPANDGKKVILTDTDHLWGVGGNQAWVWKSFLRGLNPLAVSLQPFESGLKEPQVLGFKNHFQSSRRLTLIPDFAHRLSDHIHVRLRIDAARDSQTH